MGQTQLSRRGFLSKSAIGISATAVPYCLSTQQSLADENPSKNERLNVGVIGAGGIANANMNAAKGWLDVVGIADVDRKRAEAMSSRFTNGQAPIYEDYADMISRDDIDVIHVATPDHWHAKSLIEAMRCGKDVYCEKPLTYSIDEGKLVRKVQKETGRIVQVGTQQRSSVHLFLRALAIVAEGRLGKIKKIQVALGSSHYSPSLPVADVPERLNWDRWLGPAPKEDYRFLPTDGPRPYTETQVNRPYTNCHFDFRWWYQFSAGKLTDWGAHHVDIATWAMKLNDQSAVPISVGGETEHPVDFKNGDPVEKDRFNTATKFNLVVKYEDGVEMLMRNDTDNGILITGDQGRIFVSRGRLSGKPVEDLADDPLKEGSIAKVYRNMPLVGPSGKYRGSRATHWANFVHCVRERLTPISDVHSHMDMLNVCHLAGISARLGRTIKWNNAREQIVSDDHASSFLSRPYREGYEIKS